MKNKYKVYYKYVHPEGTLKCGVEGIESWFLLTQTGKLMSYSPPGTFNPNVEHDYIELVPLFSTGYHGKNKEEIFEGDILNNEVEVYWNINWYAWCVRKLNTKIIYKLLYKYIVDFDGDEIEKTGTVYEI